MGASRPRVTISAAATIDGRIATRTGDSAISSERDRARVHRLRAGNDAILVGKNTVLRDDPLLSVRHARGPNPVRVVLDPAAEIPEKFRIFRTAPEIPTIVVVTGRAGKAGLDRLSALPVHVIAAEGRHIPPGWLLDRLADLGIRSVMVEGGGRTNWEFVKAGAFDEIVLTVSPRLAGGDSATSVVGGEGFGLVSESPRLRLVTVERQGDEVVLHYENRPR